MATTFRWDCEKCDREGKEDRGTKRFKILLDFSRGHVQKCEVCSLPKKLYVKFPFGLNCPDNEGYIEKVFLPAKEEREHWQEVDGSDVEFFPFLVVWDRTKRGKTIWLPYWHIVGGKKHKYGQWAPNMDDKLFRSLLRQAGY